MANRLLKGPDDEYTVGYRVEAGRLLNSRGEAAAVTRRLYKEADYATETAFGRGVLDALSDWDALS
jgi:hypothetical protein